MIVRCDSCGRRYDDASRWTICPHNSLNVAHDAVLCRRHDLYNCYLCEPGVPLLTGLADTLPIRSIERDIVVSASLYLQGDIQPGGIVERWWNSQGASL